MHTHAFSYTSVPTHVQTYIHTNSYQIHTCKKKQTIRKRIRELNDDSLLLWPEVVLEEN